MTALRRLDAELGHFLRISGVHARPDVTLCQFGREDAADFRFLVDIVDLVAASAPADPSLRHALRVTDGDALMLEREVTRRRRASVEMLMKPHIGRLDQRADLPFVALR